MADLALLDATAQAALVRERKASARELVDAAIARIEALNSRLNAVITPLYEPRSFRAGALSSIIGLVLTGAARLPSGRSKCYRTVLDRRERGTRGVKQGIRRPAAALAAACALALTGVACGSKEEAPPVPWNISKESVPAELPKDLPIYPNAKFEVGVTRGGGVAIWRTSDPLPAVQRYFIEELRAKGWRVAAYPGVAAPWLGEGGVTIVASAWGRRVSLALGTQEGTTAITAVWNGKQAQEPSGKS